MSYARSTATTTTKSKKPVTFFAPDEALGDHWHPSSKRERELLTEALLPTLKLWARWLLGVASAPAIGETIYAQMSGFRHFLVHDLRRDRWLDRERTRRHEISPEMISYCWYRLLTERERRALDHFARSGEQSLTQRGFFSTGT